MLCYSILYVNPNASIDQFKRIRNGMTPIAQFPLLPHTRSLPTVLMQLRNQEVVGKPFPSLRDSTPNQNAIHATDIPIHAHIRNSCIQIHPKQPTSPRKIPHREDNQQHYTISLKSLIMHIINLLPNSRLHLRKFRTRSLKP